MPFRKQNIIFIVTVIKIWLCSAGLHCIPVGIYVFYATSISIAHCAPISQHTIGTSSGPAEYWSTFVLSAFVRNVYFIHQAQRHILSMAFNLSTEQKKNNKAPPPSRLKSPLWVFFRGVRKKQSIRFIGKYPKYLQFSSDCNVICFVEVLVMLLLCSTHSYVY